MRNFKSITDFLSVFGILVTTYSVASAQLPAITARPKTGSLQAPVIEPRRTQDGATQNNITNFRNVWFLIEYDGATVGYESLTTTQVSISDNDPGSPIPSESVPAVRRSRDTHLKLKRLGNDLSVSSHLETVETVDGVLQSWSLRRTSADGTAVQKSATWDAERDAFLVKGGSADPLRSELIQCVVQPRSPVFSAWLAAPGLERPHQWASAVFFPETSAIVDVEIRQMAPQSLRLRDGSTIAVTRYDYWPSNQPEFRSSVYYDREQEVALIEQPLMGRTLRFYRTDAATALGEENLEALDLQFLTGLPLRRPLINPEKLNSIKMMISVGASDQISLASTEFQTVEQTEANSLIVTLTRPAADPDESANARILRIRRRADKEFTETSRWLDWKNDSVRRLAVMGGGAVSDPREKCRRLTTYVSSHVRLSAFSTLLRPASEVVKSRQGDCTEFAVLLAALMRSEGVPSRVSVGFAYVPNPPSLAPHMWTEAWIEGQWIPYDATLGADVNPLTRLKVVDSSLSDDVTSGTLLYVPLLTFMGRATVEILADE